MPSFTCNTRPLRFGFGFGTDKVRDGWVRVRVRIHVTCLSEIRNCFPMEGISGVLVFSLCLVSFILCLCLRLLSFAFVFVFCFRLLPYFFCLLPFSSLSFVFVFANLSLSIVFFVFIFCLCLIKFVFGKFVFCLCLRLGLCRITFVSGGGTVQCPKKLATFAKNIDGRTLRV
jgi:hypothetical protein